VKRFVLAFALSFALCALYLPLAVGAGPTTSSDFLLLGDNLLAAGHFDQAIENYSQAIRLRLDDPQAWFGRGRALTTAGRFRDAIDDLDQAIHLRPEFIAAYVERGFAYGQAGDFNHGIEDFNRVLASEPSNLRALTLRGDAQARLGNFEKAIEDFSVALTRLVADKAPDTKSIVRLHLTRSHVYTLLGKHQAALEDRNEAVRLAPEDPDVYLARGGSFHEVGLHKQGLADRTEAIRLKPDFAEAWFARGSSYFLLGDYRKASQDLNEALRLRPNYAEAQGIFNQALMEFAKDSLGLRPTASAAAAAESNPGGQIFSTRIPEPPVSEGDAAHTPGTESSEPASVTSTASTPSSVVSASHVLVDVIRQMLSSIMQPVSASQEEAKPVQSANGVVAPPLQKREASESKPNPSVAAADPLGGKATPLAAKIEPTTPKTEPRKQVEVRILETKNVIASATPPTASPTNVVSPSTNPAPQVKTIAATAPMSATAPAKPASLRSAAEHNQRGRDLIQQRKYRDAVDEFSAALHERSDFALALNGRGFAHMLLLEWAQAKDDLDAALRLDPNYANAYYNRAAARRAMGDIAGADADAVKVRELTQKK
jgi:tetratricopeptide (TPR) repeat protein